MRDLTATEAARRFSEILDAVEHDRETYLVHRHGRPVARISPATASNGKRLKEFLRTHRPDRAWSEDLASMRALLTDEAPSWNG